ncbi:hypothetical protein Q8F55_007349 [Vanrija albida]|uniref:Uncharacterized protein n=1 Tax=Vanrija albida TaxID=181172 RepID=A0ABR3PTB5_9TREE
MDVDTSHDDSPPNAVRPRNVSPTASHTYWEHPSSKTRARRSQVYQRLCQNVQDGILETSDLPVKVPMIPVSQMQIDFLETMDRGLAASAGKDNEEHPELETKWRMYELHAANDAVDLYEYLLAMGKESFKKRRQNGPGALNVPGETVRKAGHSTPGAASSTAQGPSSGAKTSPAPAPQPVDPPSTMKDRLRKGQAQGTHALRTFKDTWLLQDPVFSQPDALRKYEHAAGMRVQFWAHDPVSPTSFPQSMYQYEDVHRVLPLGVPGSGTEVGANIEWEQLPTRRTTGDKKRDANGWVLLEPFLWHIPGVVCKAAADNNWPTILCGATIPKGTRNGKLKPCFFCKYSAGKRHCPASDAYIRFRSESTVEPALYFITPDNELSRVILRPVAPSSGNSRSTEGPTERHEGPLSNTHDSTSSSDNLGSTDTRKDADPANTVAHEGDTPLVHASSVTAGT